MDSSQKGRELKQCPLQASTSVSVTVWNTSCFSTPFVTHYATHTPDWPRTMLWYNARLMPTRQVMCITCAGPARTALHACIFQNDSISHVMRLAVALAMNVGLIGQNDDTTRKPVTPAAGCPDPCRGRRAPRSAAKLGTSARPCAAFSGRRSARAASCTAA